MAGEPSGPLPAFGSVPVPDPTLLTTQIVNQAKEDIRREMASLRELIEARVAATEGILGSLGQLVQTMPTERETVVHAQVGALRTEIMAEITRVNDVANQKFIATDSRFQERDERTAQSALDSRISLDAALAAAKELVSLQASNTEKQIGALETLMRTNFAALQATVDDLKGRVDRGEGGTVGKAAQVSEQRYERADRRLSWGTVIGVASVAAMLIVGLTAALIAVLR